MISTAAVLIPKTSITAEKELVLFGQSTVSKMAMCCCCCCIDTGGSPCLC
ncbi:MAG: hypothetical protein II711_03170 [Clostridia bacterium]|nr:hypothetical protein [Clostridia bacterium]